MRKGVCLVLALVFVFCLSPVVFGGTLDDIAKRGEFMVGVRDGAIPFGFYDKDNKRAGFSLDVAEEFRQALEKSLGKPIKITFKTVNPKTRIPLVANKTLDIVCGSSTHTVAREDTVDFTLTVFLTGTQILVKKDSGITGYKGLAGKRVGAAQGSTNEKAIRDLNVAGKIKPEAKLVVYQEHSQGMLALQKGVVDAYCTDGILLAGLRAKAPNPKDFKLAGGLITYDPYAYIVRENDSNFLDFINAQFIAMIKDGRYKKLYYKWFGAKGVVPYPMTSEARTLMKLQAWP